MLHLHIIELVLANKKQMWILHRIIRDNLLELLIV